MKSVTDTNGILIAYRQSLCSKNNQEDVEEKIYVLMIIFSLFKNISIFYAKEDVFVVLFSNLF